jgi:hypothetical protein
MSKTSKTRGASGAKTIVVPPIPPATTVVAPRPMLVAPNVDPGMSSHASSMTCGAASSPPRKQGALR